MIGVTLTQLGEYDRAYHQFRYVDTTYQNTLFASASNFEIGELYRTRFLKYDSASYYFSKFSLQYFLKSMRIKLEVVSNCSLSIPSLEKI